LQDDLLGMFRAGLPQVLKVCPGGVRMPGGFRGAFVGAGRYTTVTTFTRFARQSEVHGRCLRSSMSSWMPDAILCRNSGSVSFWSSPVAAEGNCPSGFYPIGGQGVSGCAPIPGAVAGTASPSAPAPAQPLGEWLTRWGAVAESPTSNLVGTAANESSERCAVDVAIKKCAAEGAKDCKSSVTYYNQCVAFAVPSSGKGQGSLDTAVDAETVAGNAIGHCRDTGGGNCAVVYSEFSLPVFRKY